MKSLTDIVINQPKSALSLLTGEAELFLDMETLIKEIHTKNDVILEKDSVLLEKDNALLEKDDIIKQKSVVIDEQKKRIAILEEYLRLERARLYGRSTEKFSTQGEIFNEAELVDCATDADDEESADPDTPKPRSNRKGRKPLSPSLPRYQERIELSEEEKQGAVDTFFTKVREELDIIPAKVRVKEILQEKAVFIEQDEVQQDKRVIKAAELPRHPIPKSAVTVCMLAHIIVAKYCDALPLYRQEKILARYGGSITRTTMANWLIRLSLQLQPLINLMMDHQRSGNIINADETTVQVIKETTKSINSDKYMWVTLGGPPGQPSVLFHYDPSRSKEVPLRLFEGFSGYLQTDGYASYNAVCKQEGITQLGCFDHVRRKFTDAKKGEAKPGKKLKNNKVSKADVALGKIRKLYAVEDEIKELSAPEKQCQRQQQSKPLLDDLHAWLEKNITRLMPGSLTHGAMSYALNQWPKLIVYCEDGNLNISNAAAENAIRPFTIGRKNWLFSDTPNGARASAMYYSLIESAKANGMEPFDYLSHILKELPYADTVEKLEKLLPWAVRASGVLSKST